MRRLFADLLFKEMKVNPEIILVTGDLGYKMWDEIRDSLPNQFYNAGSAEQLMTGIGIGLALSNKIPIIYSITPFLLYRPFELIRNYINHEKIPVKLIGSGRGRDYLHDGFSHWAEEDISKIFPNILQFYPEDKVELNTIFSSVIYNKLPCYVNLKR